MSRLPDVHFGRVGQRRPVEPREERDPDDEELAKTPDDVIALLGFDPKERDQA